MFCNIQISFILPPITRQLSTKVSPSKYGPTSFSILLPNSSMKNGLLGRTEINQIITFSSIVSRSSFSNVFVTMILIPITIRLTPVCLVGESRNSTLQWYTAWSSSLNLDKYNDEGSLRISMFNLSFVLKVGLDHSPPLRASKLKHVRESVKIWWGRTMRKNYFKKCVSQ